MDARLDDMRHACDLRTAMNKESLHVAACLPGHRRIATRSRQVRLEDATLSKVAERVAVALKSGLQPLN